MKPEPGAPKRRPARPPQEEHVDLPTVVQRPAWSPGEETPRWEDTENWGKRRRTGCGRDKYGRYIEESYYINGDDER